MNNKDVNKIPIVKFNIAVSFKFSKSKYLSIENNDLGMRKLLNDFLIVKE